MIISEIFRSIQGESTLAGTPTLFIRCSGCNLDCKWCDTPYARTGGRQVSITEIIKEAEISCLKTVCITGGEPLLQPESLTLTRALLDHGFRVSIETNGTLPVSVLPVEAVAIIDIKCPGSGYAESIHISNLKKRRIDDEYKCVITDRRDFDFACNFVSQYRLDTTNTVLFSPIMPFLPPATLAKWIIEDFPSARLNLQLHRFIWPDDTRSR